MKRYLPLILVLGLAAAAVIAVMLIPAPAEQSQTPEPTEAAAPISTPSVSFADPIDINDVHLRDNTALYEDDDPYDVVTMYLTVQRGNPADGTNHTWEEVNSHSAYYYDELGIDRYKVAALLQVGDENGPISGELGYGQLTPNATVQVRGQTSSRNPQKNYKIELYDNFGSWNQQKSIALNKHQGEGMRFRNKMMNDLMAEIPQIIGMRTQFVHLYVRDLTSNDSKDFVDYGLYTQVEQLNKSALRAHGLDKNGNLYKVESCEFYEYEELKLATDPEFDRAAFEDILEIKGNEDHTKLLEMLHTVNDYTLTADEVLDRCFDRENLSYWMAFMLLVGNCDTQNRNAFIYSPLNSDTWYYLPWDSDSSLREQELQLKGRSDYSDWERGISNYWGNMIFRRALTSSSFRAELDAAIHDLRDNYLTDDHIRQLADRYSETVRPYIFQMPDLYYLPLTTAQNTLIKDGLADEIERNYERYVQSLNSPMPFYVDLPVQEDGSLELRWEASFDMMNSEVTYNVILARDYHYQDILYKADNIRLSSVSCDLTLEPGQYFLHVNACNTAGYTMNCFDTYITAVKGKIYGTYSFYVKEDGTIEPFTASEGDE